MEDFRHLSRIAEIHGRRGHNPEDNPRSQDRPAAMALGLNLRRVLLSFTVVTGLAVGMAAWWGM